MGNACSKLPQVLMVTRGSGTSYQHPNVGYLSPRDRFQTGWYDFIADVTPLANFVQSLFVPVVLPSPGFDLQAQFVHRFTDQLPKLKSVGDRLSLIQPRIPDEQICQMMERSVTSAFLDYCSFHDTFVGIVYRALGGAPLPAIVGIPETDVAL